MLGLYVRLYRIIYRAHEQFISFQDESSSHGLPGISSESDPGSSTRRTGRPSTSMHITSKDGTIEVERHGTGAMTNGQTHVGRPGTVLKKLAKQMMYYPLAYMLIWTIPTSIRIYQSVTGVPAPFGIATVDKVRPKRGAEGLNGADEGTGLHRNPGLRRRDHLRLERIVEERVAQQVSQNVADGSCTYACERPT